ncbi:14712_t:CDS:2, partial [Gigaspora margarita]
EQMFTYMDKAEQMPTYMDEAEQMSFYIDKESNPIQSKGNKAKYDLCRTELVYQDGTTLNLKKHLKIHRSRVPELNESKVKKGSITVIKMLNNKAS